MKIHSVKLGFESLESRKLCAADLAADFQVAPVTDAYLASSVSFHNASKPADVDGDGAVSPIDALRLIDMLNRSSGSVDLTRLQANRMATRAEGEAEQIGNVDTNNDGSLNPIDVLVVIDAINASEESDDSPIPMAFATFDPETPVDPIFEQTGEMPFEFPTESPFKEFPFGEFVLEEFIDLEKFDWSEYDFSEVTEEDFDTAFEEFGFNQDWVKRGGLVEEMPMMFSEEFPVFEYDAPEIQPVYAMVNSMIGSISSVALFSQNGPFAQVLKQMEQQAATVNAAPVTYFSSNFLRGNR